MAKYYCILFDADNTLLNFDAAESEVGAEAFVNYGIAPEAETVVGLPKVVMTAY